MLTSLRSVNSSPVSGMPTLRRTVLDAPSAVHLAYRPGVPLVAGTWASGVPQTS